jgi:hypothetical protein
MLGMVKMNDAVSFGHKPMMFYPGVSVIYQIKSHLELIYMHKNIVMEVEHFWQL